MLLRIICGLACSLSFLYALPRAHSAAPPAEDKEVAQLIVDLGSEVWKTRELASSKLAAMLPARSFELRKQLAEAVRSPDLEVRRRAEPLLRIALDHIYLFHGARVSYSTAGEELYVSDIIEALSKAAGTQIGPGPGPRFSDKRLKFSCEKATIWEAVAKLEAATGMRARWSSAFAKKQGIELWTADDSVEQSCDRGTFRVKAYAPKRSGETLSIYFDLLSDGIVPGQLCSHIRPIEAVTDTGHKLQWIESKEFTANSYRHMQLEGKVEGAKRLKSLKVEVPIAAFGDKRMHKFKVARDSHAEISPDGIKMIFDGQLHPEGRIWDGKITIPEGLYRLNDVPAFRLLDGKGETIPLDPPTHEYEPSTASSYDYMLITKMRLVCGSENIASLEIGYFAHSGARSIQFEFADLPIE